MEKMLAGTWKAWLIFWSSNTRPSPTLPFDKLAQLRFKAILRQTSQILPIPRFPLNPGQFWSYIYSEKAVNLFDEGIFFLLFFAEVCYCIEFLGLMQPYPPKLKMKPKNAGFFSEGFPKVTFNISAILVVVLIHRFQLSTSKASRDLHPLHRCLETWILFYNKNALLSFMCLERE